MPSPSHDPAQPASDIDRIALEWFVRELRGLSHPESVERDRWLQADERHQIALHRWRADWTDLNRVPADSLARVRQNLQRDKGLQARRAGLLTLGDRNLGIPRRRAMVLAGSTLGVAAAGAAGVVGWQHLQQPVWQQQFASRRGQQLSMQLPDGSRVQIDTQSRLQVQFFRDRRELRLTGQAAFQVASDSERPFHVFAGDAQVTVVGTRFTVRHTPEIPGQAGVQVAVAEGRVRVAIQDRVAHAGSVETLLGPGQQVGSDGMGQLLAVTAVDAAVVGAWRHQRVSLEDVTLAQAVAEFERYGDTRLRIDSPAVAALRITGTFNAQDLANFRQALPQILPVRLLSHADGWTDIVARG